MTIARNLLAVAAAALMFLIPAGAAHALDVRTDSWTEPHPEFIDSNPEPLSVSVRFDNEQGVVEAVFKLAEPVPDPAVTSKYRQATVNIELGTSFSIFGPVLDGDCSGTDRRQLEIETSLGDDKPPVVATDPLILAALDAKLEYLAGATKTFNETRDVLTVRLEHPRLVGANYICWGGGAGDAPNDTITFIRAQTFQGFSGSDGDKHWPVVSHLADQIMYTNNVLGPRRQGADSLGYLTTPVCTPAGLKFRCSASVILRSLLGRPRLNLSGTSFPYDQKNKFGDLGIVVEPNYHGALTWKSCPSKISRRRGGRTCRIPIRWKSGDLDGYLTGKLGLYQRVK